MALYEFKETSGTTVSDTSGVGTPLNLVIQSPTATSWGSDALSVNSSTIVKSSGAATKIIDALMATNQVTIEAWVKPANTTQGGPSRIVSLSASTSVRNFTLAQQQTYYDTRLRTTSTSSNGIPSLSTPSGTLTTQLTHVVYTRSHPSGATKTYINGTEVASGSATSSSSNWDTGFQFAFANELTMNRTWLGELHLVAIYDSPLSATEVTQNYNAGPKGTTPPVPTPTPTPTLTPFPVGTRVASGLVALYELEEGSGTAVNDTSGVGTPLNLTVENAAAVSWVSGGLSIDSSTIVKSSGAATKIIDAAMGSNEITIEAWVKPGNLTQGGPSRIATLSANPSVRNFTLAQQTNYYNTRLRSTSTSVNGIPSLSTPSGTLTTALTHVVFTRDHSSGTTRTYVNGSQVSSGNTPSSFSNWDQSFKFALANELTMDRTWLGELHLVAIYSRELSASEVSQNYNAGPKGVTPAVPTPSPTPTLTPWPVGNRVVNGLIALYDFEEGSGATVNDVSGVGAPLNLTVENMGAVSWMSGGLSINSSTIVKSGGAATKIIDAVMGTSEITIEGWVKPANLTQGGPSRIVTLSANASVRNFTLAQQTTYYDTRMRTTSTSSNGTPSLSTPSGTLTTQLTHVVYTRSHPSGDTKTYVNGAQVAAGSASSSCSNWDQSFKFALANELTMDRTWLGELHLVAVYDRALTASEATQNYNAGPKGTTITPTPTSTPIPTPTPTPGPAVTRVTSGIVALYEFEEGSGTTVNDVSGAGAPLNLTVENAGAVSWVSGGLSINSSTIVKSAGAATKIIDAAMGTSEVTIEAWVKPANTNQSGPSRIVTLSANPSVRNFTLGQSGSYYNTRLRSTSTSVNGIPSLSTPSGSLTTALTHVVFTRDHPSGTTRTYIHGSQVSSGNTPSSFSNWDQSFKFGLANELTMDRTWLGELHLVAIYSRDLSASEVTQNFNAGPTGVTLTPTPTPTLTPWPVGTRVAYGLVALYELEEGSGTAVNDTSGVGTPLNLTVESAGAVSWVSGGLSVNSSTIVKSVGAATKIIDAAMGTNEITIEGWVKPANLTQGGPSRIVTLSANPSVWNFTLGQSGGYYNTRLRSTSTSVNGIPSLSTPSGSLTTALTHVVFTRSHPSGDTKTYINGAQVATGNNGSSFSNWDQSFKLALANELTMDRTWLGELHLVAVYSRALSSSEVSQNYAAGSKGTTPPVPSPTPTPTLTPWPVGTRVASGLVALYEFKETSGSTVSDTSGVGTPLNLTIQSPAATSWGSDALSINSSTIASSAGAAAKIIDALKGTNQITIEGWVKPANTSQGGPSRIVTLSANTSVRNFTLGQQTTYYATRLRTTSTSVNGTPSLSTASGTLTTALTHVVYTRSHPSGDTKTYINGVQGRNRQCRLFVQQLGHRVPIGFGERTDDEPDLVRRAAPGGDIRPPPERLRGEPELQRGTQRRHAGGAHPHPDAYIDALAGWHEGFRWRGSPLRA